MTQMFWSLKFLKCKKQSHNLGDEEDHPSSCIEESFHTYQSYLLLFAGFIEVEQ